MSGPRSQSLSVPLTGTWLSQALSSPASLGGTEVARGSPGRWALLCWKASGPQPSRSEGPAWPGLSLPAPSSQALPPPTPALPALPCASMTSGGSPRPRHSGPGRTKGLSGWSLSVQPLRVQQPVSVSRAHRTFPCRHWWARGLQSSRLGPEQKPGPCWQPGPCQTHVQVSFPGDTSTMPVALLDP